MLLFADQRVLSASEERVRPCAFCGKSLVVLPDDKRGGACFDCLVMVEPESVPCPECAADIPAARRAAGCLECGWYPHA
ncbi:MAG TPA: hypothetical protein VFG07_08515 [Thermoplasmata archaeon]|nr:hypothetical protein [Thermoplasmata archaeon]